MSAEKFCRADCLISEWIDDIDRIRSGTLNTDTQWVAFAAVGHMRGVATLALLP
jgi:hypothetical protein